MGIQMQNWMMRLTTFIRTSGVFYLQEFVGQLRVMPLPLEWSENMLSRSYRLAA